MSAFQTPRAIETLSVVWATPDRERMTVAELIVPILLSITFVWPFWSVGFVLPLTPVPCLYFVKATDARRWRHGSPCRRHAVELHDHTGRRRSVAVCARTA